VAIFAWPNGNQETARELQAVCQYDPRHNLPQPRRIPALGPFLRLGR
jgi:hypothetical protein